MDRFADGMIARGPTFAADRATWTGSLHIVDLPSAEAAHRFVEREPYNRAGLFEQHLIRRFNNLLGRTMWESPGGSDDPRFLVIADAPAEPGDPALRAPLPDLTALAGPSALRWRSRRRHDTRSTLSSRVDKPDSMGSSTSRSSTGSSAVGADRASSRAPLRSSR
jgi:YCII-related domain-containing protein